MGMAPTPGWGRAEARPQGGWRPSTAALAPEAAPPRGEGPATGLGHVYRQEPRH